MNQDQIMNESLNLTSLNMSPTHFATVSTIIRGRPKVMFPVASINMTVKLSVIRTIPPVYNINVRLRYMFITNSYLEIHLTL